MERSLRLPGGIEPHLVCPDCRGRLVAQPEVMRCDGDCRVEYPVIDGIPILINEHRSLFRIADFTQRASTYFAQSSTTKALLQRFVPTVIANCSGRTNYAHLADLLTAPDAADDPPKVLVLGGGILGTGMELLLEVPGIQCLETDVALAPRTQLVCDGTDIPLESASLDAVVAQAVLEHVVDVDRCLEEIYRVLKPDGLLYVEVPFIQQVHGGRYDFTRYTHLGLRRLLRLWKEIDSGVACGPGSALAWSWCYFLASFTERRPLRRLLWVFGAYTSFLWKYLDPWLKNKRGSLDAASGFYFLGRKSAVPVEDRAVVESYHGMVNA